MSVLAVCLALLVLIVGAVVDGSDGVIIGLAVVQVLAIGLLLRVWLSLQATMGVQSKLSERILDDVSAGPIHRLSTLGDQLASRLERSLELDHEQVRRLAEMQREMSKLTKEHLNRIVSIQKGLSKLDHTVVDQRKLILEVLGASQRKQFQQMEALEALYQSMDPERGLPPTRSWAASPDLLRALYDLVVRLRPKLVIECGSGVSTLVMAYAAQAVGEGRIVALEHEEFFRGVTLRHLREHGVADFADVRLAPLTDVELDGETWPWYELDAVPDEAIDLLLIDGPPGETRPDARYPALPLLRDRLSADAIVLLDDHNRPDEQAVFARWREQFPEFDASLLAHEKGTAVLRLAPNDLLGPMADLT